MLNRERVPDRYLRVYPCFLIPLTAVMILVNAAPKTIPHANNPSICTVLTFSVNSNIATVPNATMRATFLQITFVCILCFLWEFVTLEDFGSTVKQSTAGSPPALRNALLEKDTRVPYELQVRVDAANT